ncbi:histidine phosphatase family protein [Plantactinospora siamensis]|uniref:Histidine phosphatase family protein n=1 Tax=Plantactinospora siamensis TaxID=555372 RepID=A0ABV6NSJ4_9ACTN
MSERGERRIVLLRHAKAERPDRMADPDRALTSRGHADAAAAGAWLDHSGYRPEEVICSPAKRTRQTWHDVALGLTAPHAGEHPDAGAASEGGPLDPPAVPGLGPRVRYEDDAYDGRAADLFELLRTVGDDVGTALLVGHNPTISELSELLDPVHADPDGLRTCGLAIHAFSGQWSDLAPGRAPLERWYTARG